MAIDRTGISSLNTGAGEITYSGNQGPKSPDQQLMASADPMLIEMYEQYVFEMEEQGMQPMSFKEFVQQAMSGMATGGRVGYQSGGEAGLMGNPAVMEKIENMREFRIANPNIEDIADYKGYYERLKRLEQLKRLFKGMKPMSGTMGPEPGSLEYFQMMTQKPQGRAYGGMANPTYTQKRKQNLAYGGIAGVDGRKRYGLGSFVQGLKDKIVDDIIPNEIKENPILSAAVAGGAINQFGLPDVITRSMGLGEDVGQNWIGNLLGGSDAVIGGTRPEGQASLGEYLTSFLPGATPTQQAENQTVSSIMNNPFTQSLISSFAPQTQGTTQSGILNALLGNTNLGRGLSSIFGADQETGGIPLGLNWAGLPEGLRPYMRKEIKSAVPGVPATQDRYIGPAEKGAPQIYVPGTAAQQAIPAKYETKLNPVYPISMGLAAGEFARRNPGPMLPADTARDASKIDLASAIGGDNLRFKLDPSLVKAANGGRIGYNMGGNADPENMKTAFLTGEGTWGIDRAMRIWQILPDDVQGQYGNDFQNFFESTDWHGIKMAQGGRIGYDNGGIMASVDDPFYRSGDEDEHSFRMFGKPYKELNADELEEFREEMMRLMNKFSLAPNSMMGKRVMAQEGGLMASAPSLEDSLNQMSLMIFKKPLNELTDDEYEDLQEYIREKSAQGGRIGAQEGGLMDLGGMEKDYRNEGGFVPIGGQERADDVPARLSKNEFVFTADAVRAAGGGNIDKGAEVMENMMENLEKGGKVSEESQGLKGARDMFATAQRLEGVL